MAASSRTHRTLQALTELPPGAKALDFVRSKRPRVDAGGAVSGGADEQGSGEKEPSNELRAVRISVGQVAQAAGSATVEMGRAKLQCAVNGPRPDAQAEHFSESGRLLCHVKFAAFSGVSEDEVERHSRELELIIHPALEAAVQLNRFPKSVVEVHVLVLEREGDICGPAITGASLALADAGIEMYDLVAACSITRSADGDSSLVLDPASVHGTSVTLDNSIVVSVMPARGEVTQLSHVGEWNLDQYEEAMDLGLAACKKLHVVMREALVESASLAS